MSGPDRVLDVLFVSPERFRVSPQIGLACRMTFDELALYLSRPSVGESKDAAGAWSPALYRDNVRRKANLIAIGALVVDLDEHGDVDEVAGLLGRYRAIVHETFSSANDHPRCRAVLELAQPIDAQTYEASHRIVRMRLAACAILADEGAKDASRLSYSPVRRHGAGYRFKSVDGAPLDARAVAASEPVAPPRPVTSVPAPEHHDRYLAGALRRAADDVGQASEGVRHYTLCREAFALARLGLSQVEIEAALLPAFVATAGERREHEGRRTIRDALQARRGAA